MGLSAGVFVGMLAAVGARAPLARAEDATAKRAAVIRMEGMISPRLDAFVVRSLDKARRARVDIVVFEIDSPGGYLTSSFDLAERFQQLAWAKGVAYVPREALSGAAIASLGCADIRIASDARWGNAGPIYASEDGAFRHVPEKVRSDLALRMRQLAEHHGRPATLAEALVDSQLAVFEVRDRQTHAKSYLSMKEWDALPPAESERLEKGAQVVESGDGRFLELLGKRAAELGLANGVAESREDLLASLGVIEPPLVIEPVLVDRVIGFLNHPFVTGVLFLAGLIALYVELSSPGLGLGGGVATLCFSLFFWSRFLGGTAGWLEVILFMAGLVFLLIEFFVLPGFGVSGLVGVGLIILSLVLASHDFVVPRTAMERQSLLVTVSVLLGSGFLFLGAAVMITRHIGRIPILSRLMLEPPEPIEVDERSSGEGEGAIMYPVRVGDVGCSESPLRPAGKALFGDAYVDVVADGAYVEPGRLLKVIRTGGNRIVVREIDEKPAPGPNA
ncbi:MAG: peptidase [Planctomycetes bacterium]|nr:peptidase [Planctomycetota bacterium]